MQNLVPVKPTLLKVLFVSDLGGKFSLSLPLMIWLLIVFWLLPQATQRMWRNTCHMTRPYELQEDYYRPGDLIVGGNLLLGSYSYEETASFHRLPRLQMSLVPG